MFARPLALILGLAPLSAAAFGDMDCVVTETCNGTTCDTATEFYEVTFDWAAESVSIIRAEGTLTLPMIDDMPTQSDDDTAALSYGRENGEDPGYFRVEATAGEITAVLLEGDPTERSSYAVCERKQAI